MYRGTFIDARGRKRTRMGFFTLSKPNAKKYAFPVIVEARDKASAANKIKSKYHIEVTSGNLRKMQKSEAFLLLVNEI